MVVVTTKFPWPAGQSSAAAFTFDVDGESAVLAAAPGLLSSMSVVSHQAYGPLVGVRKILSLLEQTRVRSTFFVPGYTAERYPGVVRNIAAAGHEIAHHGFHHERPTALTPAQQREELLRGTEVLERLTGERPIGYRAPMWDLSWEMPSLLHELGFLYDSSLMDGDEPYKLAIQDTSDSIIEIPIHWALDDWEQYCFIPAMSELGPIQTPAHALELWRSEFRGSVAEGGAWVLTNHPFLSGRPGRILALSELIDEVLSTPGVWTTTLSDIATHTRSLDLMPRMVAPVVQT